MCSLFFFTKRRFAKEHKRMLLHDLTNPAAGQVEQGNFFKRLLCVSHYLTHINVNLTN